MWIRRGYKYQQDPPGDEPGRRFRIPNWWPTEHRHGYECEWIKWDPRYLELKPGFAHNGANAYPDHDWIIVPSAVHDAGLTICQKLKQTGTIDLKEAEVIEDMFGRWFAELAEARMPKWRKFWNDTLLLVGVNELRKIAPGAGQAELHRAVWYD